MLTGPEAGITRDAIAVDWTWRGQVFRLVDTAGIRRKAKVVGKLEKLSVGDALRAIRFAEIVVLVMDATEPLEKQDLQLADLVESEGRALVLALNKWDLVADPQARLRELNADLERNAGAVARDSDDPDLGAHRPWARPPDGGSPRDPRHLEQARPDGGAEPLAAAATERHPPPAVAGRRIKLKYLTQSKTRPPTFFLSCSRPEALPDAYRRYLVNGLREDFGLAGVPIRLMLRRDANPFEGRKRRT